MAVWVVSQISRSMSSTEPAKALFPSGKNKAVAFCFSSSTWEVPTQYKQRTSFRHRSSDELEQKLLTSCRNESSELGFDVLCQSFFSSLLTDLWCGQEFLTVSLPFIALVHEALLQNS